MLSAIIPLRDRSTVAVTAASLLAAGVDTITIVDAESADPATCQALHELANKNDRINIVRTGGPFQKARLLNLGIRVASAPRILVTDADIIWTQETISELAERGRRADFVHVARVVESDAVTAVANRRLRCDVSAHGRIRIMIERRTVRPGYGLVFASRDALLHVGGYSEDFVGWGWEDVDLLARSHALGHKIDSAGSVLHLTHGDDVRDLHQGQSRVESRNANIMRSLERYRNGEWFGALRRDSPTPPSRITIFITRGASRELCAS
jgi:glycosyltransferase involved in cell wall biosynthesis